MNKKFLNKKIKKKLIKIKNLIKKSAPNFDSDK